MKRAKSATGAEYEGEAIEGAAALRSMSQRTILGPPSDPETLPQARDHFESELRVSMEKSKKSAGFAAALASGKRSYGLISKMAEGKWKCGDGEVFPTHHLANEHIKSLRDNGVVPTVIASPPPVKRRKRNHDLDAAKSPHVRTIKGADVDFKDIPANVSLYFLARHWFQSAVGNFTAQQISLQELREHQQSYTEDRKTPSPQKKIPPVSLPRVSDVKINSHTEKSAADLLNEHLSRWKDNAKRGKKTGQL